jgi:hypothetical protein
MVALPSAAGWTGLLLLVFGGVAGLAVASWAWPRLRESLAEASGAGTASAAILTCALASSLAVAPLATWRMGRDIQYVSGLSRAKAEESGALRNGLEPRVFAALRAKIPPQDTYYAAVGPGVPARARDAFADRAATELLPRLPRVEPILAQWIVTWGRAPADLGVPIRNSRVVAWANGLDVHLARVAR